MCSPVCLLSFFSEPASAVPRARPLHGRLCMRPLTFRKLFFQCLLLLVILFFVVVVALKFGAVPVSLYALGRDLLRVLLGDRKSTRLNSSHTVISYAVFCLKKKK